MDVPSFVNTERLCEQRFLNSSPFWHLFTLENFPIIFHNKDEFKMGMNLFALSIMLFPVIKTFSFELMSNHIHSAMAGNEAEIKNWFQVFCKIMAKNQEFESIAPQLSTAVRLNPIESLDALRNNIAYVNRNGSVINPDETPFSYPWGANRYYFNPEAMERYKYEKKIVTFREKRIMSHSGMFDKIGSIYSLDGIISPMCFCSIEEGQLFYRNARQYLSKITKNLEAQKEIASSIGESIFYSDDDLYSMILTTCSKKYGCPSPAVLTKDEKLELAKMLHFDYNAGNKQIARMLKLEISLVNALFP